MKKRRFILDDSFFHLCSRALYLSKRYQSRIIRNTSVAFKSLNIFHDHRHACRQKWTLWNFIQKKVLEKHKRQLEKKWQTWHTEIISQNAWSVILVFWYEMPLLNRRSTVYSWLLSDARTPVWFSRWRLSGQGVVFVIILWMWTSRQSKVTINFLPPVWESGLIFIWKTAENYVFRMRPSLGKNSKFELLGWLNECQGAVFVIIKWMWTSRQSRLTVNFFAPSVGKWFNFYLKNR